MQISKISVDDISISKCELPLNNEILSGNDNVIIYSIFLPQFTALKTELGRFLNTSETDRANRFHNKMDSDRFTIYRSILKMILASYTNTSAHNIVFEYGANKKPYLANHPKIHFNISHAEDFAVIAVSSKEIGIDVEYLDKQFDYIDLIPDIFTNDAANSITTTHNQKEQFYKLWTRKEAFVKAIGKGIDEGFKEVPCIDGQHFIDSNYHSTSKNWKVNSFLLTDAYCCSVAFEESLQNSASIKLYTVPSNVNEILKML
ncbi:4'-phosphopantetheinyl transferase family protein [Flavobacterium algicola]|uniref:4'-phosphopantetheinyl transferase family protein n=1 Tax=Flavobacterium algicola TaxID=556529 RepID=UPI001EFCB4C5|nr:4'-phosphopantetheinyl transferase superfamily protein [Flavobacterium algicola]MCG9793499.1 4'-phosphopantetheinyl transferase superfamily protein [Flavobacterium algicola]